LKATNVFKDIKANALKMIPIGTRFLYLKEKGYEGIVFSVYIKQSNSSTKLNDLSISKLDKYYGVIIYNIKTNKYRYDIIKPQLIKPIFTFDSCINSIVNIEEKEDKEKDKLTVWKKGATYNIHGLWSSKSIKYNVTNKSGMTIVDIEYDHQTQYKKFDNVTFSDIVTKSIDIENIMVEFQTKNSMDTETETTIETIKFNVGDIFEIPPHYNNGEQYKSGNLSWKKYNKYNRDDIINMDTPKKFGIITQIYSIKSNKTIIYIYAVSPYYGIKDTNTISIGQEASCNLFEHCKFEGDHPINVFEIINLLNCSVKHYSFKTPKCNDIYKDEEYTELFESHKFCQQHHIKYPYKCANKSCNIQVLVENKKCKKCNPKQLSITKKCTIEGCVGPYLYIDKYVRSRNIKTLTSNTIITRTQYMYGSHSIKKYIKSNFS
jgi:hypothetical protein